MITTVICVSAIFMANIIYNAFNTKRYEERTRKTLNLLDAVDSKVLELNKDVKGLRKRLNANIKVMSKLEKDNEFIHKQTDTITKEIERTSKNLLEISKVVNVLTNSLVNTRKEDVPQTHKVSKRRSPKKPQNDK